jgi:hypothetical protein
MLCISWKSMGLMEFNPSVDDDDHITCYCTLVFKRIKHLHFARSNYTVDDVASSIMGTAGNPTRLFVVMTKD